MNFDSLPDCEVQIQVYDSVVGQIRVASPWMLKKMHIGTYIAIPYPDPLVIPMELAIGPSWGECRQMEWPE
jgi:hypothetical protein